jgi:hypothetical protein
MENQNSFYLIFDKFAQDMVGSGVRPWFIMHYTKSKTTMGSIQRKFNCIRNLRSDVFATPEFCSAFARIFCLSQKVYHAFSKLAYMYKLRKAIVKNDSDLYLNPISTTSPFYIEIYQERFIYRFTLQNLIHLIEGSITNTRDFIAAPIACKNPYNNIPFSNAILYTIYCKVKASDLVLPDMFHRFFLCFFDLKLFSLENESLIRERAIIHYLNTSNPDHLYDEICGMLDYYPCIQLKISKKFPKDRLVVIMKPYLYLFFLYKYSTQNPEIQNRCYYFLKLKLAELVAFNPLFGRKHMVKVPSNTFGGNTVYKMSFHENHPSFTINNIRNMYYYSRNMYIGHINNNNNNYRSIHRVNNIIIDSSSDEDTMDDDTVAPSTTEVEDYNDF